MIMPTPTISEYLKFANLQMAAEAFLVRDDGTVRDDIAAALIAGNNHASRFTETQAIKFTDPVEGWTVLDQRANTATGFSGTLFTNNRTGELVLSFRSTEFIDDAARDNEATNKLEINDFGFAFGQLADMETWYAKLQGDPSLLKDKAFAVTGYSLGGHLATACNLIRPGGGEQVLTINGTGYGDALLAAKKAETALPQLRHGVPVETPTPDADCQTPASNSIITNGSAGFPGLEARWRTAHDCAA